MYKILSPLFLILTLSLHQLNGKVHSLVEVSSINPNIQLDIRYATTNNFTQQKLYKSARCFLCTAAAHAIDKVQKELEKHGLCLLIWDGYRPLSAQKKMWNIMPDERYVMPPTKGSRHNRGCAVDCTIVQKDGTYLEMPTDFDDFTEKAHRDYMDVSPEAIKNRALLETIMHRYGFKGVSCEWWHFDFIGWEEYPVLNIDFDEL